MKTDNQEPTYDYRCYLKLRSSKAQCEYAKCCASWYPDKDSQQCPLWMGKLLWCLIPRNWPPSQPCPLWTWPLRSPLLFSTMSYSSKSWGKSAAIAIVAIIAAILWISRIFVPPPCPPAATLSLRCRPGGILAAFYPQIGIPCPCCQDRWHSCAPGGIRTRLCTLIRNTLLPLAELGMLCSITFLFILFLCFFN